MKKYKVKVMKTGLFLTDLRGVYRIDDEKCFTEKEEDAIEFERDLLNMCGIDENYRFRLVTNLTFPATDSFYLHGDNNDLIGSDIALSLFEESYPHFLHALDEIKITMLVYANGESKITHVDDRVVLDAV